MQQLPPSLAALRAYPQFILYRVAPSRIRPGKTDKFPVNWRTAAVASAHDAGIWMDADRAITAAAIYGAEHGVGFVLTEQDPFWFLDIDDCLAPDGWSPLALSLCERLAGAAVEISQSGRGLHIIGSGAVPPHGCKNAAAGLELYHAGRFVALTGNGAMGDAGRSLSPAIGAVAAEYFPAAPVALDPDAAWTTAPRAGYGGPADDDALIERMLSRTSPAAAFGNRATPRQLWEGDEEALGRAFPDSERAYDASGADSALAFHLAYWTGNDCGRILRLMQRSALVRDKWERPDYLPRTILRACSLQQSFPEASRSAAVADGFPDATVADATDNSTWVLANNLPDYFRGCIYITDRHAVWTPNGAILKPDQFRVVYSGKIFETASDKNTRNAWEAFSENLCWRRPIVDRVCFRPECEPGGILREEGLTLVNTYVPIETEAVEGDPALFLEHVRKLLPDSRDQSILINYMAAMVQNPGVKFEWCPVIQGVDGNGKTLFIRVLEAAIGKRYTHYPNAQDLGNKFTGWLDRKLFIAVEEIYVKERREVLETLKVLVAGSRIEFQSKGSDQITGDNRANFLMCTNHQDAVPKTDKDRRYAPLFTAQQTTEDLQRDGMDGAYFSRLYGWLDAGGYAVITHYLRNFAVAEEFSPLGNDRRAPFTSSTPQAILASMGAVEQAVLEEIELESPGFKDGWISMHMLGKVLEARGLSRMLPLNRRGQMLQTLGYVPHPALPAGRANNPVLPDGVKARLFVRKNSIAHLNIKEAAEAGRAYSAAQGAAFGAISQTG